tara:strand:- start:7078 stop:7701 length:624 start_codon:yes stop_codon:yes gene_type:complete
MTFAAAVVGTYSTIGGVAATSGYAASTAATAAGTAGAAAAGTAAAGTAAAGLTAAEIGTIASGTIAAAGVGAQYVQGQKVAAAQKDQARVEQAISGEKSARARRQTMAQAQVARAEIENMAGVGGASKGSAAITAGGNVAAQAAENVSTINFKQDTANMQSRAAQNVQNAGQSSIGGMVLGQAASIAAPMFGKSVGKMLVSPYDKPK